MHVVVDIIRLKIGHWVLITQSLTMLYLIILTLYIDVDKIRSKSNFILNFALPKAREGVVNVWNCYITAVGSNGIKSFDLHIIIMYPFYVQQASPKIKSTF